LNPGRRGGKPATNRFSYGAACHRTLGQKMHGLMEALKYSWNDVDGGTAILNVLETFSAVFISETYIMFFGRRQRK
jgi:hypothetical protein